MINKTKILNSLAGLWFFLALTPNIGLAEMPASAEKQTSQFQENRTANQLKACCRFGRFRFNRCRIVVVYV